MPKTTADTTFTDAERAELAAFLDALKVWWQTPAGATGEHERTQAVIDSFKRVQEIGKSAS